MTHRVHLPLLSNASAAGAAVPVGFGGEYLFDVAGTFGGATVGIQVLGPDGATWIALRDSAGVVALTAAGAVVVSIPAGRYRATITGGSGVSVSARLRSIKLN